MSYPKNVYLTMCMGNPRNISQCNTCARLARSESDEDRAKYWPWQEMITPCDCWIEK